jgi:hypothetical protein
MIRWAAINTMTSRIAGGEPPHGNNAGTGPTNHDPRLKHALRGTPSLASGPLTKNPFT